MRKARHTVSILCLCVSLSLAVFLTLDVYPPVSFGLVALYAVFLASMYFLRPSRQAFLTRLCLIAYAMPFFVCWRSVFGLEPWWREHKSMRWKYMLDPEIISVMTTVGLIGLIAFAGGVLLRSVASGQTESREGIDGRRRVFRPWVFALLLGVSLCLSWINAPSQTILDPEYSYPPQEGIAHQLNFNSLYIISYGILVLLFLDTEREPLRSRMRACKRISVIGVSILIVLYFQLLRGDRDSIGLVLSLSVLYITDPFLPKHRLLKDTIIRYATVGVVLALVGILYLGIQTVRVLPPAKRPTVTRSTSLPSGDVSEKKKASVVEDKWASPVFGEPVWGAVLLTNLSMAAQYEQGRMDLEWGQTYLDYVQSLPPGVLTKSLGIQRPIERGSNPSHWTLDITCGGSHIVNVPFKNFLGYGVAIVLFLYGIAIGSLERRACSVTWHIRLLYGTVLLSVIHWFWYGEMYMIRTLMAYGMLVVLYWVSRKWNLGSRTVAALSSPARSGAE